MSDTSVSLLERAGRRDPPTSWSELVAIYDPLLRCWLARFDLQGSDADDVVQEVFAYLAAELPQFDHNGRTGAFRAWLRSILLHRIRKFWRNRQRSPIVSGDTEVWARWDELEDPASGLSGLWDREHDQHLARELLQRVRSRFSESTWRAFEKTVLDEKPPAEVAAELGLSVNAVCIAKSRVLQELRREGRGLIG